MKKFFLLILCCCWVSLLKAQLLLNEVYTDPGSGKHEFFELFNPEVAVESTDSYTMVTFLSTSTSKGFYVLDMPALQVANRGFFVGSSNSPFNFQGTTGSIQTNFSWNDTAFLAANTGGLSKWILTTNNPNANDNNPHYDREPVTGLNDFFTRMVGAGSSFVILLYKNGVIVNSAIFGAGGSTTVPAELLAMPPLYIDMAGNSPDFTIDFSAYGTLPVEKVNQDAGSDNGFIRKANGSCGSWTKSSSQNMHTPQSSNANEVTTAGGTVVVTASITPGSSSAGSQLTYSIGNSYAAQLPVELFIYVDNGSMYAQLDVNDQLLANHSIIQAETVYNLTFKPFDQNIIIVVKKPAGCIDHTRLVGNTNFTPLPLRLLSFSAERKGSTIVSEWSLSNNENAAAFELEGSADGRKFMLVDKWEAVKTAINGHYKRQSSAAPGLTQFRLKYIDQRQRVSYSAVVKLAEVNPAKEILEIVTNPVYSSLRYKLTVVRTENVTISIYNAGGHQVITEQVVAPKGSSSYETIAAEKLPPGFYLAECVVNGQRFVKRFLKV